jgi:secreted Zn-dependent insulinase-like peptidase
MGYCSRLAKKLHDKSAEEVLYYPYMMEEWKPALISDYLNELTTDNLAVICENKKF